MNAGIAKIIICTGLVQPRSQGFSLFVSCGMIYNICICTNRLYAIYIEILKLLAIYKICNYRLSVLNCDRYTDVRDRLSVGAGRIRGGPRKLNHCMQLSLRCCLYDLGY